MLRIYNSSGYSSVDTYIDKTRSGNLAQYSQNRTTRTGVMPGKDLVHTLSETREPNNAKKGSCSEVCLQENP